MKDAMEQEWRRYKLTITTLGGWRIIDCGHNPTGLMDEGVLAERLDHIVADHNFALMKDEIFCALVDCRRHPRAITDAKLEDLIARIGEGDANGTE